MVVVGLYCYGHMSFATAWYLVLVSHLQVGLLFASSCSRRPEVLLPRIVRFMLVNVAAVSTFACLRHSQSPREQMYRDATSAISLVPALLRNNHLIPPPPPPPPVPSMLLDHAYRHDVLHRLSHPLLWSSIQGLFGRNSFPEDPLQQRKG